MTDTQTLSHYVDGAWRSGATAYLSRNPSDLGDVVAEAPEADAALMDEAIAAARRAYPAWSDATTEYRADILHRAGELLISRAADYGRLLSREEGKTLPEGVGEVTRAGRIFRYFAGEAVRRHGLSLQSIRPGIDVHTARESVGVFGLITPWNFPIAIPAWKAAPALAFGNCVILKPATPTPALAVVLAQVLEEAGLPRGVFNLVHAGPAVSGRLLHNPDVDGVSFTGSTAVGLQLARLAGQRPTKLQLEMGGKNPLLVMDDADLEIALQCAVDAAFFSAGQRCTASSRIIVTPGIHDRFVSALVERTRALRIGNALSADTQIGPVATEEQMDNILSYFEIARTEGARVETGGGAVAELADGLFISPTVLLDCEPDMRVSREEIFGPVASVLRADSYEEALSIANQGDYGLAAGIATTSLATARHFQRHVRAGMVMVNVPTAGVDYHVPFGGTRQSSFGPKEQGFAAAEFFTSTRTVYTR